MKRYKKYLNQVEAEHTLNTDSAGYRALVHAQENGQVVSGEDRTPAEMVAAMLGIRGGNEATNRQQNQEKNSDGEMDYS